MLQNRRTALITGGSRGLGAAMALELGKSNVHVAVNYFADASAAASVCRQIESSGGKALPFQADVREESAIVRLVDEVSQSLGPIDILVLNATGVQPMLSIEEQTWASHLDQLEFS